MNRERIAVLLGRPEFSHSDRSAWVLLEQEHGIRLPPDFREFVDLYGPGRINTAVTFQHPSHGRRLLGKGILDYVDMMEPAFGLKNLPAPIGVASGHLLPFAHVMSGVELLFQVAQDPEADWPVCAYAADVDEFKEFGWGFEEWLVNYLEGSEEVKPWVAGCGDEPATFVTLE